MYKRPIAIAKVLSWRHTILEETDCWTIKTNNIGLSSFGVRKQLSNGFAINSPRQTAV